MTLTPDPAPALHVESIRARLGHPELPRPVQSPASLAGEIAQVATDHIDGPRDGLAAGTLGAGDVGREPGGPSKSDRPGEHGHRACQRQGHSAPPVRGTLGARQRGQEPEQKDSATQGESLKAQGRLSVGRAPLQHGRDEQRDGARQTGPGEKGKGSSQRPGILRRLTLRSEDGDNPPPSAPKKERE